jgi:deoxyadenosine/deoxycytidine kinase
MRIIIEGPDGSGKSTLAEVLSAALGVGIRRGEGPEKWPGEINDRAMRWLEEHSSSNSLFDRHPCVSHPIYSRFTPVSQMSPNLLKQFYQLPCLFIYCRGLEELDHIAKDYDSAQHLRAVEDYHTSICRAYDDWALEHAHIIYNRTTTKPALVAQLVKGLINA